MKQLLLISASFLLASSAFAQSDNSLYQFDNTGSPKNVRLLGANPEFPFLRNMTSSRQVYNAIKRHENENTAAMNKLNDLLMQVGYANGAKDLEPGDITEAYVPPGTEGNMGSRGYTYNYYRLSGSAQEYKAWKIKPNDSKYGSLYIFAKCGNAFFPKTEGKTACINVPVNVTPDVQQISLPASGSKVTAQDKVYVYYGSRKERRNMTDKPVDQINDRYHSKPLLVDATKDENVIPETYTVSAGMSEDRVTACPGKTLDLTANVNVEKTSSYTGNYPKNDHKVYKKVSKHRYHAIARKMRKAERKADKIARRTGVPVERRLVKI